MQILIVGAGAVGGYFGGRLAQAGRDVTFLVRDKRAEEIRARGLQILSPYGNLTLHPKIVTANQIDGPFEAILLGVKSYALAGVMDDLALAVGSETMILPVLNGMSHIHALIARFGSDAVLGGVCLVATEIDPEGRIRQLADFQKLIHGELDGRDTARVQKLGASLRGAGFDVTISSHIVADMWQKWVQLASLGAVTCLLRGNVGEIAAVPGGAALALSALRECADISTACGYPHSSDFLEQQAVALTAPGSPSTSSMYRDLKKGASVEVDSILGDLLEHGAKHNLTTPILQAAFVSLSIYQHRSRS